MELVSSLQHRAKNKLEIIWQNFTLILKKQSAYQKTRTQDSRGPYRTQDARVLRTLEDPGSLRTQDPREPRTLEELGL